MISFGIAEGLQQGFIVAAWVMLVPTATSRLLEFAARFFPLPAPETES